MKKIYTLFILFCIALNSVAQIAVDPKGTKISVDSSKWKISGTNIYTKNTGNVGIGTSNPTYKLDVNATANPLRLTGVQTGSVATDSVLTIINGVVKKIATSTLNKNDSTTANNGITLTGKNIQLGGNLIQSTTISNNSNAFTIATGGSAFNITGLTAGASTDSILTVNTTTGKINRISPFANTTVSNTNTAPNSLTTTVNGVTGAAVAIVNSVSNTSSANSLRTTVNGVAGSNVNIINSNTLTQNGSNQLVSTINGISSTALTANITGDVTGNLGASTVSKINGSPLGTTTGASNGQVLTWNGTAWAPATVVPTTTVSNTNNAPNSLTTTVNGVTGTAVAIVNSVSNNSSGNNLTTTVNGISGTTVPIVNSISNNLSGSTLTTTVNGVTGSSVNLAGIIPATTNNLSLSGNTLTSTVNGLSATSNSVGSVNNTSSGNNLTTSVNGVTSTTVPIVNSISNTSAANTLSTTVNGISGSAVPIVNSISNSSSANNLTTSVNGVTSTSVPIVNSISNTSSGNNLTTTVNGITGAAVPMVNSISNNLSGSTLTTTVNGVTGAGVNLSGLIPTTTHTLAISGNTLTSTVNGIAAISNTVNTVSNTSSANSLTTSVNGVASISVPIVNSISNTSSGNNLTTTVNGIAGTAVPIVNTISNNLSGSTLTTTVNGVTGAGVNLSGLIPTTTNTLAISGNTLTSTVNGIAATSNTVNTVSNTSSVNSLTTSVNGVAANAVNIINSNALSLSNGALTSTVNGVASPAPVNILATANNGLTATNGTVQLGGSLSQATTLATAGNALNITGLTSGSITDSLLTISATTGKLSRINPSILGGNYIANATTQQANSNFNISGNGIIGGNLNITGIQKGSILYMNANGLVSGVQNNMYYDTLTKSVGIGTSSPIRALDVTQNSTNGLLKLQNTNVNGYSSIDIWDNLSNQVGNIGYANNGGSYSGSFYFATNITKNMVFATNNIERMRIDGNNGNVGIGVTLPTAALHLKAGSAIANTAPLKFSSGTLLTTPETGAIEFDGTHFYGTISSNRYQLDQQKGMDSTTASNGLTLNGLNVQLGGNLSSNTTIGTGAYDLRITGLTAGASTDSILTINPTTGKINRINPASLSGAATNALNFINLASSFSSTSTTEANVTGWNFEVTAGKTYKVEVIGDFQTANTNTGVELGFYLTNSGAGTIRGFATGDVSSNASTSSLRKVISTIGAKDATNSFLVTTGVSQTNTPHSINAVVTFTCSTSGTFNIGFATEVSSSAAQLNANSSLIWQQLN